MNLFENKKYSSVLGYIGEQYHLKASLVTVYYDGSFKKVVGKVEISKSSYHNFS
jgi:predicted transcriptional regulator